MAENAPHAPKRTTHGSRARSTGRATGAKLALVREQRVRHCMILMARGSWISGISSGELQRRWGVSEDTMGQYSGEASRRLKAGVMLDDDLRVAVLATLQSCVAAADELSRIASSKKNLQIRTATEAIKVKLDAVKALASVSGVESAKKVDVGGSLSELLALAHSSGGPGTPTG